MSTHSLHSRFVGLALLLQVVVAFGPMRGLVLCVGPAGHVAVEDDEAALRCRDLATEIGPVGSIATPMVRAPATCVDTLLLGAAPHQSTSPLRFAVAALATVPVAELPRPRVFARGGASMREPPPASARILRSVILLI